MTGIGDEIWSNWREGKGPCADCPNRDCNGFFEPQNMDPGVTSGTMDPELVFVGDAPSDKMPDGELRPVKNYPESSWDNVRKTVEEQANEHWSQVDDFLSGSRIPDWFFDEIGYRVVADGDIYFTNAKKCADIHPKGDYERENAEARSACELYLQVQLAVLNPDVIVTFGINPTKRVFDIFNISWPGTMKETATEVYKDQYPAVVPSYHWSGKWFKKNVEELDEIGSTEDYWSKLAESIHSAKDSDLSKFIDTAHKGTIERFEQSPQEELEEYWKD